MNITGIMEDEAWFKTSSGAIVGYRSGNAYKSSAAGVIDNSRYDSFTFDASRSWTGEKKKE